MDEDTVPFIPLVVPSDRHYMAMDDDLLRKNPFEFELASGIVNDSVIREAITRKQQSFFVEQLGADHAPSVLIKICLYPPKCEPWLIAGIKRRLPARSRGRKSKALEVPPNVPPTALRLSHPEAIFSFCFLKFYIFTKDFIHNPFPCNIIRYQHFTIVFFL